MRRELSWPNDLRRVYLALAMLLLAQEGAFASYGYLAPLDPATYQSRDGKFVLQVDPSERDGAGEASYRLMEGAQERWAGKLPFTLLEAGVTNTGIVAGYAYTEGRDPVNEGEFLVVAIDQNGKVVLREATTRQQSRYLHTSADPTAIGFFLDEHNDRFVVRLRDPDINRAQESWWGYKLSELKAETKLTPSQHLDNPEAARRVLAAQPLPGTPLTLVHWWRFDLQRVSTVGAIFALVDLEGRPVWTMELPDDYEVPGNEKLEDQLHEVISDRGAILACDQADGFDVLFAKAAKKVHFTVKRGADGDWAVKETLRTPYELFKPAIAPVRLPAGHWKDLGPVELKPLARSEDSPIHHVYQIEFDDQGRIAFFRAEQRDFQTSFVLVDDTGKVLQEIPLAMELPGELEWKSLCYVGKSRWVIAASSGEESEAAQAWWLDAKSREIEPIENFDCPAVDRLVGFADGGFVASGHVHREYTIEDVLRGFDASGRSIWSHSSAYGQASEVGFVGADDIARTARDEIVALDTVAERLFFFDRLGKYLRKVELAHAWGHKPTYPADVASGANGGLIVNDFNARSPVVVTNAAGKDVVAFAPKFEDGRKVDVLDCVQAAPDGRLWTCDGDCILRLKEDGIVDRVLGKAPKAAELGKISGIAVSPDGRIFAVDKRTGTVHAFDATGAGQYTGELNPNEFDTNSAFPSITVSNANHVYLGLGSSVESRQRSRVFAHFSADGKREANVRWPGSECFLQPGTNNTLAVRFESLDLFDSSGKLLRRVERQPDGKWLRIVLGTSFAPDGRFAVVSDGTVSFYTAAGEPVRVVELPDSVGFITGICFDGKRLFVCSPSGIDVFNEQGQPLETFDPPKPTGVNEPFWMLYSVADGDELLLFEANSSTLHRYRCEALAHSSSPR